MRTELIIPVNKPYNLRETIRSHGWVDLLPNYPSEDYTTFSRVEQLRSGKIALLSISGDQREIISSVKVEVTHVGKLANTDKKNILEKVNHMLRLSEDLGEFYEHCKDVGGKWKNFPPGGGYLLRSPSVFEDLVKVICTTNIQWGGTKRMIKELVDTFGKPLTNDEERKTFPTPEAIAFVSLTEFKEKVRLGYRTDYIYKVAVDAAEGSIDLTAFNDPAISSEKTRRRLLSIKGVGPYAAASMMMLLSRYDKIPIDTVFREYMRAAHFIDQEFTDLEGLNIYEKWGEWKYLAYWFEMINYYRNDK